MNPRGSKILNLIAASTALTGLLSLSSILLALTHLHKVRIVIADAHLTVIAGLSLIYLATLLRRGKHNAWIVSVFVYAFLIVRNVRHFVFDFHNTDRMILLVVLNLLVPSLTFLALIYFRSLFNVRSEIRSFAVALRRAALVLVIALLYGIIGFQFFDEHDFHQEIPLPTAVHYTVDQTGLTTAKQLTPYTKRARLFVDSLAAASLTSVFYVAVSFFAPIRFRLSNHRQDYLDAERILRDHSRTSEDFFKLWPQDKAYFFSAERSAFLAYRVVGGVALAVGDPVGPKEPIRQLLKTFTEYCRLNDWDPAFIHTDENSLEFCEELGFSVQKIGEEALVDIEHFNGTVVRNKYFRHINNKFTKQNYSYELLMPPHSVKTMTELRRISDDWLKSPGRAERGFMMGYFADDYMQLCKIMAVRDADGLMQAFLNQVPSYKPDEANYDFLRQAASAQSNTNDFLMINFMTYLSQQDFKRVNMGLSPLTGLGPDERTDRSAIGSLLHFVYANADRFYSFQGLARFKSKYEPRWESRYIVYTGGMAGFAKTMNALLRAMSR